MLLNHLSNNALLESLQSLVEQEAHLDADVIMHLLEIEERRLHLERACPSMFEFLTRKIGMSDAAAGRRIAAARMVKRFPGLLDAIRSRRLHLSSLLELERLIVDPRMTAAQADELVTLAAGKSKRAVQELVASLAPRPDAPSAILVSPEQTALESRRAGEPTNGPAPSLSSDRESSSRCRSDSRIAPSSPARYTVQLTADRELLAKIERAQDMMRHQNPSGDLARLLDAALDSLLEKLEKQRLAKLSPNRKPPPPRPSADPGRVSRAARREVMDRDGAQCSFVGKEGERCASRAFLEVDHHQPRARGGTGEVSNLRVLCRAHNRLVAEQVFGKAHVEARIAGARPDSGRPAASAEKRVTIRSGLIKMSFRAAKVDRVLASFSANDWQLSEVDLFRRGIAALT